MAILIKIGYAFVWQEETLPTHFLYKKPILMLGIYFTPTVYKFADHLSGFYEHDDIMNHMGNTFPGHDQCRTESPHAFWHDVSANALMNFAYLANHINDLSRYYEQKHAAGDVTIDLTDMMSDPMALLEVLTW